MKSGAASHLVQTVSIIDTISQLASNGHSGNSGIYRDKTMDDKLMYIPNYDTQNYLFCTLKLVVKTFEHLTNQSKFS